MESFELKPNKTAFINYHFVLGTFGLIIALGILSFLSSIFLPINLIYFFAAFVLLEALSYYSLIVRYKKEKYVFHTEKIFAKGGGIFHDRETELVVKNITHVTMIRPWIENKLFNTGHVIIELAGSARAEAVMLSIDNPEQVYKALEHTMQSNGFRLLKQELVEKERPSIIGVFFETIGPLFAGILFLLFTGIWMLAVIMAQASPIAFIGLLIVVVLWIYGNTIIRFLDLMKRVYYIYNDTIVYTEGFLTKVDSFVPLENLADSEITQTLVDKIFGLYDVKISCQGVGYELLFKNIVNGPLMEKNIDTLINQSSALGGTKTEKVVSEEVKATKIVAGASKKLLAETAFTANYTMDMIRTIAPGAMIPIILIFIGIVLTLVGFGAFGIPLAGFGALSFLGIVGLLIKAAATKYSINPKGMTEKFDFLNSRNIEFSNDKITGIVFKRDFIDEWFNTFSTTFWSIGATHNVNFANVKEMPEMREKILAKFVSLKEMIKADLPLTFALTSIILGAIIGLAISSLGGTMGVLAVLGLYAVVSVPGIILLAVLVIYFKAYYKTSKIHFFKDYVHFETGIFYKFHFYALYDNIKDITTIRYPASSLGSIIFNVAGESMVTNQKGQKVRLVPHHFRMNYIPKVKDMDELIDLVLYKRPSAEEVANIAANIEQFKAKNLVLQKPLLANSLLVTGIILLVLTAIAIIMLLTVPIFIPLVLVADVLVLGWVILSIKAMSFSIQPYRVVAKSGIFYKMQTSIVFTKIDHLKKFQGITHKIFGNGTVIVHTTGSRMPEIIIRDIPKYNEFYSSLESYY